MGAQPAFHENWFDSKKTHTLTHETNDDDCDDDDDDDENVKRESIAHII